MIFKKDLSRTSILALLATLSACSHGPVVQDFPDTANPAEEVKRLDADMITAFGNQAQVLSPRNFELAQESLTDAKKGLEKQNDSKDTLHQVAEGRTYLNRANEFAKLSRTNMEEVVVAREQAVAAGAPGAFASDFNTADERLKDVTADIEKNDLRGAGKNRSALQARYLDLELTAIKQFRLKQSRDIIALAVGEGAKELAPRMLAVAEKDVKDTDAFITGNRHASSEVESRAIKTLSSANHVLKITRESKAGQKTSSEETALQMETEQGKVVHKQILLSNKQAELDHTQVQLDSKNEENRNLENGNAFNHSFEEARSEFTAGEAEVYKQGNILMIRLRGLEFPSSQAVLKGSNFPLLAKVQKVIRDFGKSSIIVEGHTDSRGGSVLNEKLSSDRAEAVKEYLVANAGDQALTIKAVGYGYQKPLSTNKTSNGRAQNRRVDILIERTQEL